MFNLLAGAFMSMAGLVSGVFGGHGSTTPLHRPFASSTPPMHAGPGHVSTSTPHMPNDPAMRGPDMPGMMNGVAGIVTSTSGSSFTLTGKMNKDSATTTYSVDASTSKVLKKDAAASVAAIAVGDHVMVGGKVTGSSVVASVVIDGMPKVQQIIRDVRDIRHDVRGHEGSTTPEMRPAPPAPQQ